MNNLLLILGLLALSNGNVSLFGNKDKNVSNESLKIDKKDTKKLVQKTKKSSRDNENRNNKNNQSRKLSSSLNSNTKKIKKIKKIRKNSKHKNRKLDNPIQYNVDDIKAGIKLMDLSEEDLDRGMEIITRTKKYMSSSSIFLKNSLSSSFSNISTSFSFLIPLTKSNILSIFINIFRSSEDIYFLVLL